jgi:hypothetical protein
MPDLGRQGIHHGVDHAAGAAHQRDENKRHVNGTERLNSLIFRGGHGEHRESKGEKGKTKDLATHPFFSLQSPVLCGERFFKVRVVPRFPAFICLFRQIQVRSTECSFLMAAHAGAETTYG